MTHRRHLHKDKIDGLRTVFRDIKDAQNVNDYSKAREFSIAAGEGFALFNNMRLDRNGFCLCELASGRRRCPGHFELGSGLGGVLDHPIWFKKRDTNAPAAMVCQPYDHQRYEREIAKVEEIFGLNGHIAPAEKCAEPVPGGCYWIVFTRPHYRINWLPEQADALGEFGAESFDRSSQGFLHDSPPQHPRSFAEWSAACNRYHVHGSVLKRPRDQAIV